MSEKNQPLRGTQLAIWMASKILAINFSLTARVRGSFTSDQLERALEKLQKKHPPLTMKIKKESKATVYLVPDASLEIPVRRVDQAQADDWIGEVTAELVRGFDLSREPPLRLVWLVGDEFSDMVLVCPHSLADGLSMAYLVRDLLDFLGEAECVADPMPMYPALSELIPHFPGKQWVVWKSKIKSAVFKTLLGLKSKRTKPPITNAAAVETGYQLLNWKLTPEQTTALVARSRVENTTVHAALCTAFLRAFGEFHGNGWRRMIQSPINLRNRLTSPVGESFGLYIYLAEFPVDCAPDHDFWDVTRAIKQDFIKHTKDKPIFSPLVDTSIVMDALAPILSNALLVESVGRVKYDLSITNLGALAFPTRFGTLQLDALYGPCISGKRNEIILGVNTLNGNMHLTLTFTDQKLTPAQAEQLKDKALKNLAEATSW
jgi:hypothetical protein